MVYLLIFEGTIKVFSREVNGHLRQSILSPHHKSLTMTKLSSDSLEVSSGTKLSLPNSIHFSPSPLLFRLMFLPSFSNLQNHWVVTPTRVWFPSSINQWTNINKFPNSSSKPLTSSPLKYFLINKLKYWIS